MSKMPHKLTYTREETVEVEDALRFLQEHLTEMAEKSKRTTSHDDTKQPV